MDLSATTRHTIMYNKTLAVLGGNDPHSYGVTSHRASMNTLRPKLGGVTWSRTKNVYHKGTDLQSADAHAIASITPLTLVHDRRIELLLQG